NIMGNIAWYNMRVLNRAYQAVVRVRKKREETIQECPEEPALVIQKDIDWGLFLDEIEEFFSRLGVISEYSQHARSRRSRVDLLHSSHHHTHVTGLDNDSDSCWLNSLHHCSRDLLRQSLLHCNTSAEHFGDSSEFGETENLLIGEISNVHLRV
ncbi:hypothetical protein PENTCL1PPCAC_1962, partial [Pristionchus entomophagus]